MTPEQAGLIQKAKDSLRGARALVNEALYDFAVSRAYYSMFYIAEAFLLGEGLSYSKHSAVVAAFGQKFAKTGIVPSEYHRYLIDAEEKRSAGDYKIFPVFSEEETNEQIERAEMFIEFAENNIK
jgi:uncharacterized protein (UPF0332 family)